jgi:repressor LexA
VIQARIRDPVAPTVHGRNWRFNEPGKLGRAAEILNDFVAEPLHGRYDAIIAPPRQGSCCVNRARLIWSNVDNDPVDIEQLKRLMAEHGESQAEIARLLQITRDKVSKTLSGKRRLTAKEADTLRRYFASGEVKDAPRLLPIIGLVSAGTWREGFADVRGYMPSPSKSFSEHTFVVEIDGDSMDLVAKAGEQVIVDPEDIALESGGYYVVRNGDGEMTFKRYMEAPARLEPCSTNPEHKPILPGRDTFIVVGRARKKVADL